MLFKAFLCKFVTIPVLTLPSRGRVRGQVETAAPTHPCCGAPLALQGAVGLALRYLLLASHSSCLPFTRGPRCLRSRARCPAALCFPARRSCQKQTPAGRQAGRRAGGRADRQAGRQESGQASGRVGGSCTAAYRGGRVPKEATDPGRGSEGVDASRASGHTRMRALAGAPNCWGANLPTLPTHIPVDCASTATQVRPHKPAHNECTQLGRHLVTIWGGWVRNGRPACTQPLQLATCCRGTSALTQGAAGCTPRCAPPDQHSGSYSRCSVRPCWPGRRSGHR